LKRFQFTLAGVLRLRVQQTEAAKAELAALHRELERLQAEQEALRNDLLRHQAEVFNTGRTLTGEALVQLDEFRRWVVGEQRRQAQTAADCISRIQEQNRRVIEAKQNQQLLEKLRDRGRQRWESEAAREEQALAEEAYMSQWSQKMEAG
jgi:flagellar export protein FliJ